MKSIRANSSLIISVLTILAAVLMAGLAGDYFFDLNDDVLMKDILSGAYTGVPEGHNIQMLYPISLFISLLYRIGKNIDWYGIFLCFAQYGCFFLVIYKSVKMVKELWLKVVVAVAELAVVIGLFSSHLLFVQYTVVCGVLSATAAFLILSSEKRDQIIAVVLIIIAYLLRSEMLLLTLPMVGVAIFMKWLISRNEAEDKKALFMKYVLLCAGIVAGLILGRLIDKSAYSSSEWKEFTRLFDNRTELYDFQYIPEYEENREFYEEIGLSESEQKLLENYNFALDDEINADTLGSIAKYAASKRGEVAPLSERLTKALRLYIYRLRQVSLPKGYEYPMTDFPWNLAVIMLYIGVFAVYALGKDPSGKRSISFPVIICLLALLFACRSALWMFIIFRGRDPIRITHPLYLVELFILMALLLKGLHEEDRHTFLSNIPFIWTVLSVMVLGLCMMVPQYRVAKAEQTRREATCSDYNALFGYMKEKPENFYYIDVYTSVSYVAVAGTGAAPYTEKMFEGVDNSCYNHDILGGWASKSPLYVKKLKAAGYDSVQEALLDERVLFVQNKTEDTSWLVEYYSDKGINVSVDLVDTIADIFAVYSVTEMN